MDKSNDEKQEQTQYESPNVSKKNTRRTMENLSRWKKPHQFHYAPSVSGDPWTSCKTAIDKQDDAMCKEYSDDIDNMLLFSGLLSAVVSAFTTQSYQWLQQDPADTTNILLSRLISIQDSGNVPSIEDNNFPMWINVLINTFWFLSLTLSLSAALLGILCKQWLREYQRDALLPPEETIRLRQLRLAGLSAWRVPGMISSIPVLILLGVSTFFAGTLAFLWSIDRTVAIVSSVVIAITLFIAIATTVVPAIYYLSRAASIRDLLNSTHEHQLDIHDLLDLFCLRSCAYKSPQAWLFYEHLAFFLKFSPVPKIPRTLIRMWRRLLRSTHVIIPPEEHDKNWTSLEKPLLLADERVYLKHRKPPSDCAQEIPLTYTQRALSWIKDHCSLEEGDFRLHLFFAALSKEWPIGRFALSDKNYDNTIFEDLVYAEYLDGHATLEFKIELYIRTLNEPECDDVRLGERSLLEHCVVDEYVRSYALRMLDSTFSKYQKNHSDATPPPERDILLQITATVSDILLDQRAGAEDWSHLYRIAEILWRYPSIHDHTAPLVDMFISALRNQHDSFNLLRLIKLTEIVGEEVDIAKELPASSLVLCHRLDEVLEELRIDPGTVIVDDAGQSWSKIWRKIDSRDRAHGSSLSASYRSRSVRAVVGGIKQEMRLRSLTLPDAENKADSVVVSLIEPQY